MIVRSNAKFKQKLAKKNKDQRDDNFKRSTFYVDAKL